VAKAGGADEGNGAIYGGFARLSRLLPGSATVSPSAFIELFSLPSGSDAEDWASAPPSQRR